MHIDFLNTDLEIESKDDLSRIVEEFGEDVSVLHHGEIRGYQHASFEIAAAARSADEVINYFCALVEALPEDARADWQNCCSRVFDIGFVSGTSPQNYRSEIRSATMQRVAALGASLAITIYPLQPPIEKEPQDEN